MKWNEMEWNEWHGMDWNGMEAGWNKQKDRNKQVRLGQKEKETMKGQHRN